MTRIRRFAAIICTATLIILVGDNSAALGARPNIIVLLADDLGYGELGCQGNTQIPTPHIDSIAKSGVRFTDGYVTASYCAPSRAGLLTGRYQTRFGFELNPVGAANEDPRIGLPSTELTLAEVARDAGYATALIGKWHLGGTARFHPQRHGFERFFGFLHEGHYFVPAPYENVTTWQRRRTLPDGRHTGRWIAPDGQRILSAHMGNDEPSYDANNPILRDGQPVVETEYLTDAFTREAIDFVRHHRDRPFFLYVAYNAVHSPMQAKQADLQEFADIDDPHRRIFAGMVRSLDNSVGSILRELNALDLEQDTIVFFLSDNGGPTKELTSSNHPLRGGKGSMYEGGVRVPLLVQWKSQLPGGTVYRNPVISLDVFATSTALITQSDVPADEATPIDGVNLFPYLRGDHSGSPHPHLFWRMGQKAALRQGTWKLVGDRIRDDRPRWELYDLANDVAEQHDLAASHPQQLSQLVKQWTELNQQMVPAMMPTGP